MIQHFSEMCLIKKNGLKAQEQNKRPQKHVNGIHCYDLLGHLSGFIL